MRRSFCKNLPCADLVREFFKTLSCGKPTKKGCGIVGCQTAALKPSPEGIFWRLKAAFRLHPDCGLVFVAPSLGRFRLSGALDNCTHTPIPPPHSPVCCRT